MNDPIAVAQRELDAIDLLVCRQNAVVVHYDNVDDVPPVALPIAAELDDDPLESSRAHGCGDHGNRRRRAEIAIVFISYNTNLQSSVFCSRLFT